MSAQTDDGGPAFPCTINEDGGWFNADANGMTLRDWFAGQALMGLSQQDISPRATASIAYTIADAMLAARKEGLV